MTASPGRSDAAPTSGERAFVDQLCSTLEQEYDGDGRLSEFTREFLAKVPRPMLADRSLESVAALAHGAYRLLESAEDGRVTVQVIDPEEEGWEAPVTVIRAEVRDRPFIVDTIREYLGGENLPILHYVYPVVGVVRDANGAIVRIGPEGEGNPRALVHCEIPKIRDPQRRDEIQADEFTDIEEFLRWLTEENFVFLGYRAYEIVERNDSKVLRVEPGSGLGILRQEEHSAWADGVPLDQVSERDAAPGARRARLIISKTNAEATVHRRARMDYIGVKKLDADGEVVGEWRFLGLFTSKAYAEHADAIPILRASCSAILAASGATPGSHDYKEIITIFNSMPKEELFQASTEELAREVQTVLSLLFSTRCRSPCARTRWVAASA
jgi:glutamate dehydrogenase